MSNSAIIWEFGDFATTSEAALGTDTVKMMTPEDFGYSLYLYDTGAVPGMLTEL